MLPSTFGLPLTTLVLACALFALPRAAQAADKPTPVTLDASIDASFDADEMAAKAFKISDATAPTSSFGAGGSASIWLHYRWPGVGQTVLAPPGMDICGIARGVPAGKQTGRATFTGMQAMRLKTER